MVLAAFETHGVAMPSFGGGSDDEAVETVLGCILAPGLRHACDPNLLLLRARPGAAPVFVSTRGIEDGERLSVQAAGFRELPMPTARRRECCGCGR